MITLERTPRVSLTIDISAWLFPQSPERNHGPLETKLEGRSGLDFPGAGVRLAAYSRIAPVRHGVDMKTKAFAPFSIEALEDRIAPAALLPGGKVVTFTDIDGDNVTVKFSKPILTDANVSSIFLFVNTFTDNGPQSLTSLVLADLGPEANGVNVTVTAHRSAVTGGNGQVHIGAVDASNVNLNTGTGAGIDLGKVRIQGTVNFLDAGDADVTTPAAKSIDLLGLGLAFPGIESDFHGSIGKLTVRGNLGGHVLVKSGVSQSLDDVRIGSIAVTGSLFGSSANSGFIEAGEIGRLRILEDIRGGEGANAGRVVAQTIDRIEILGSIAGGSGQNAGTINSNHILSAKVGGSVRGGTGLSSGSLLVGDLDKLTIDGDLIGNDESFTGLVQAGEIGQVVVHGNVFGGGGSSSGRIGANDIGKITIDGSVVGGAGQGSATLSANTIDTVLIGGDLIGGSGDFSGSVFGGGKLRVVKGSVLGVLPLSGLTAAAAGIRASIFSIDKIVVGGDFINANIAVGVSDGANDAFGDGDDSPIGNAAEAKIATLIIKGRAASNIAGASFGIEANGFGTIKIGGVTYKDGDAGISFATGFRTDPIGSPLVRVVV
jgi:hypothetical protein